VNLITHRAQHREAYRLLAFVLQRRPTAEEAAAERKGTAAARRAEQRRDRQAAEVDRETLRARAGRTRKIG